MILKYEKIENFEYRTRKNEKFEFKTWKNQEFWFKKKKMENLKILYLKQEKKFFEFKI